MVMIIQNALQQHARKHELQLGAVNYHKASGAWHFTVSRNVTGSTARCLAKASYRNDRPLQVAVQIGVAHITFEPLGESVFSRFEDAFEYMDVGFRTIGGAPAIDPDGDGDAAFLPGPQ